jgi:hypothetical protein
MENSNDKDVLLYFWLMKIYSNNLWIYLPEKRIAKIES